MNNKDLLYLTFDLVNLAEARRWADLFCLSLQQGDLEDLEHADEADGLVIDLDVWGPVERERIVRALTECPPRCPVAVHSYNLDEVRARALEERGVLVFRRPEPKMLLLLAQGEAGTTDNAA
jgi:hypothetical protein